VFKIRTLYHNVYQLHTSISHTLQTAELLKVDVIVFLFVM